MQLIKRNTRNFEITSAGYRLFEGFSGQVDHYNKIINSLKRKANQVWKLNVSLPTVLSLMELLHLLLNSCKKSRIELDIAYQNREIDLVRENLI